MHIFKAAGFCGGVLLILGLIFSPVLWMIFSMKFTAQAFSREAKGVHIVDALSKHPDWSLLRAGNCGLLMVKGGEVFLHGTDSNILVKDLPAHLRSWVEAGCFTDGKIRFQNGFAYNGFVRFKLSPEGVITSTEEPHYSF